MLVVAVDPDGVHGFPLNDQVRIRGVARVQGEFKPFAILREGVFSNINDDERIPARS